MKSATQLAFLTVYLSAATCGATAASGARTAPLQVTPTPSPAPPDPEPSVVASASSALAISQGLQNWAKREERGALDDAIGAFEKAVVQTPNDPNANMFLSRAYYFLADGPLRFSGDVTAMTATFEKGVVAGERSLLAQSGDFAKHVLAGDRVEDRLDEIPATGQAALYWYCVNLQKFAIAKGLTIQVLYKERLTALMQRLVAMDANFLYGAPHRELGAFLAKVPMFAGGDMKKAKDHFDQALAVNPNYFGTKVLYADLYATRVEDRDLFVRLLTEVQNADPGILPDVIPEQRVEQEKAKRLLSQVDEIF